MDRYISECGLADTVLQTQHGFLEGGTGRELTIDRCAGSVSGEPEPHDGGDNDSEDAAGSDSSFEADVVPSAVATWCLHRAYQTEAVDPVLSFFSQVVSTHSVVLDAKPEETQLYTYAALEAHQPAPSSKGSSGEDLGCLPREAGLLDNGRRAAQADFGGEGMLTKTGAPDEDPAAFGKLSPQILGSLSSALKDNPQIFGTRESQLKGQLTAGDVCLLPAASSESEDICTGEENAPEFVAPVHQQDAKSAQENQVPDAAPTATSLLPPAIPVNMQFCRTNPRIAVSWLVQAQLDALMSGDRTVFSEDGEKQLSTARSKPLDPESAAQLACLVPPHSLGGQAFGGGLVKPSVVNTARGRLHKGAVKLLAALDAEGMQALTGLLRSWYYSGFFTGQVAGSFSSQS